MIRNLKFSSSLVGFRILPFRISRATYVVTGLDLVNIAGCYLFIALTDQSC